MPAGYHQRQERRLQIFVIDKVGKHMTFQMVDPQQRLARSPGQGLCSRQPHQQRAYQTGTVRNSHPVNPVQRHLGIFQGRVNDRHDVFNMFAGRNLRHHAPVFPVNGNLGGNDVAQHVPSVFNYRSSRFVTAAFNSQNVNIFLFHNNPFTGTAT